MKEIENFKGYFITESGQIFSNKRGKLKQLKYRVDTSNYFRIQLINDDNKKKTVLVHRLIAKTFIPNPENKPEVNHINGNKLDNTLSNLEWVTREENMQHSFDNGLNSNKGSNNGRNLLREEDVLDIYNKLLQNYRVVDLAKEYGVKNNTIQSIKDRTNWQDILKDLPIVPIKSKSKTLSINTVKWVCELLELGYTPTQILTKSTSSINIDQIYDIKSGKSFKSISEKYTW